MIDGNTSRCFCWRSSSSPLAPEEPFFFHIPSPFPPQMQKLEISLDTRLVLLQRYFVMALRSSDFDRWTQSVYRIFFKNNPSCRLQKEVFTSLSCRYCKYTLLLDLTGSNYWITQGRINHHCHYLGALRNQQFWEILNYFPEHNINDLHIAILKLH